MSKETGVRGNKKMTYRQDESERQGERKARETRSKCKIGGEKVSYNYK